MDKPIYNYCEHGNNWSWHNAGKCGINGMKAKQSHKIFGAEPSIGKPIPLTKISFADAKLLPMPGGVIVRQKGDIWKLPKSNSPMWAEQWGVQGSAKIPYIVSRKNYVDLNLKMSKSVESWACSCPAWTKPKDGKREDCKHILAVQKKEGMFVAPDPARGLDPETAKAFKKFLLAQAEKGEAVIKTEKRPGLFENRGRKFR